MVFLLRKTMIARTKTILTRHLARKIVVRDYGNFLWFLVYFRKSIMKGK